MIFKVSNPPLHENKKETVQLLFVVTFTGEVISDDGEEPCKETEEESTKYRLVGVVVHSGQASGGHYYSFIQHR